MLERNSVKVHSNQHSPQLALQKWEPDGRIADFGNFFNGLAEKPTRTSIVLNIEWVPFVLQNCEMLLSIQDLYDKNSAS